KKKFNSYLQNNFQEKLYVHTDKSSYLAGEIIWFKIYNTEAYTNRPVRVSKVAYIEILDAENKPVMQSKIALKNGGGDGALYIPVSLPSGGYTLRSYTSWMKNFDASYFFHKDLTVYNTLKEESALHYIETAKTHTIQFFSEGGNLVSDLTSKVAFRAVDEKGEKFNFIAAVLHSHGDTVVRFFPHNMGLGNFKFKPQGEETYVVSVEPEEGRSFKAVLPQILKKGVVMTLENQNDTSLKISLQS